MLTNRFVAGQPPAMRKSRLEGKPSFIPKPRHAGSTDRLSVEMRRPSNARSSSAEAPRSTITGGRLSREASATKLPINRRSRSQQGESGRFGQVPITPKRSQFSRHTTTPMKTPEDRSARSWQTSLDRALAFVTIKDQRPISNAAWQRSEYHRAQEALSARGGDGGGGSQALIRPLTITKFVDITGSLVAAITGDQKLNNDNYVTKVPHIAKSLLYPGVVSKSWLKTVNTLHAFPQALALIAYLIDLVNRIEQPVADEWLYVSKDELAVLRRDYLFKCWNSFQNPEHQFDDLIEQYLEDLRHLLGNDEEKIAELQQVINKYQACLEDEAEAAARAEEARRSERAAALLAALRSERAARVAVRSAIHAAGNARSDAAAAHRELDLDIERANAENAQLRRELETQSMSVAERTKLLEEVDYATRVQDSKRALAEQIKKMVYSKESELALWQKRSLDSCVQYKQALIHMSAQCPDLSALAVDENELMEPACADAVSGSVEALRRRVSDLGQQLAQAVRRRTQLQRSRQLTLEETRSNITKLTNQVQEERSALSSEQESEKESANAWQQLEVTLCRRKDATAAAIQRAATVQKELEKYEALERDWCTKLTTLHEYTKSTRSIAQQTEVEAKNKRAAAVTEVVGTWHSLLDRPENFKPVEITQQH